MHIKLNLKTFVFFLFFLFNLGYETYIYLMLFAMFHELGHMLIGILLGFKVQSIKILPIGFSVSLVNCNNKKSSNLLSLKKILIATAGPIVNIIYIIFFKNPRIVYTNILILMFNILPIYPLDGGRILKNILNIIFSRKKAQDIMYIVSNVCMWVTIMAMIYIVYWSKNITYIFIAVYILIITINENKKYKLRKKIYKILKNYIAIN